MSIAVRHDRITGQPGLSKAVGCEYTTPAGMAAGMCTKGLTDNTKWAHATRSIGMEKVDVIQSNTRFRFVTQFEVPVPV